MLGNQIRCGALGHRRLAILALFLPTLLILAAAGMALADDAAFDLTGPAIEVNVTRAGKTLPIADVPNLQPGDRLWIHPELPPDQSVHYLMVVAFLRGTTNPPPDNWFTRSETWSRQVRTEGIVVTVPEEAQQSLIFFAPETGGDFSSLRSAVQSKPGVFVRASQDLNQASLDRTRSDKYLAEVKATSETDPKALHDRSVLLARTLSIKIEEGCFDRPPEEQSACLTKNTDQLVLDDGQSRSMVAALTTGPSSDLMGAISATSMAGGGSYSPYVGAIVDLAKIMGSLHTANYQYIPALSIPKGAELGLRLNNPPSFRNPKSVLVVGLPAVEAAQMPPLRSVNPEEMFCLEKTPLILPTEGAPLVFSTDIAHNFVLRVKGKAGDSIDLPAVPDPAQGGFVIDTKGLDPARLDSHIKGTLHGSWGFDSYDGPAFQMQNAHTSKWVVPAADQGDLIVGREDTLHVESECAACIEKISAKDPQGKAIQTSWKLLKPNQIELKVPLKNETSGSLIVELKQFGVNQPDELPLVAYAEAAKLESFKINAGDQQGVLTGTRLDEVSGFELKGIRFTPDKLSRAEQKDELQLATSTAAAGSLQADETLTGQVDLKDGRMSFFLKTEIPESFPRTEEIEVANADSSFHAMLSVEDGNLVLQNSQTLMAVFDPLKSFGPSAFGPLRFRAVIKGEGKGDWQPLANLVRIPTLQEVRCPDSPDKQCTLSGSNLFLIDSVASDPEFTHVVAVPMGFADSSLSVPRPNGTLLYIRLRDDPGTVNMLVLPVLPDEQ